MSIMLTTRSIGDYDVLDIASSQNGKKKLKKAYTVTAASTNWGEGVGDRSTQN